MRSIACGGPVGLGALVAPVARSAKPRARAVPFAHVPELKSARKPPHSGACGSAPRADRRPEGAYRYGTAADIATQGVVCRYSRSFTAS